MRVHPILAAMRRNKVGVALIVLQMALTLAILCNAGFLIQQRLHDGHRPSGIKDEANVLVISNEWIGHPTGTKALEQADLAALRQMPGVVDAFATFSYPLSNSYGWGCSIHMVQSLNSPYVPCSMYLVGEHARKVLGVRLIAGRWFLPAEVVDRSIGDGKPLTSVIIVTRALAKRLFPGGNALGRAVYMAGTVQTIVGVIARLQTPYTSDSEANIGYSVLQPNQYVGSAYPYVYIIRTRAGQVGAVAAAVRKTLQQVDPARVIHYVRTFPEVRTRAYRSSRGFAAVLATVCAIMLVVTAFGILGLTTTWVTQRRRQIGVRRALGATRQDILQHFLLENLMIAIGASGMGVGLAIALNLWMMRHFATQRLPLLPVVVAALVVVVLGQLAVLWPALRATSISPALAARS